MHFHDNDGRCACERDVTQWYLAHAGMIRAYVLAHTHNPTLAEDCTSLTFLKALAQRNSFRCRGSGVRPWLVRIARNIVYDHHRSAAPNREIMTDVVPDAPASVPTPEQRLVERECLSALESYLERLPSEQALCIRLRFLEELSVAETARAMGRAEGAVRSLQYRAIRALRAMLTAPERTAGSAVCAPEFLRMPA